MRNYSFNVFWNESDQGYIAICPEFPGVSAFGESPEQALEEVKVALEMAIETYEEEGWALPKPKTHSEYSGQFRVRLPKHLHAKLVTQAETERVSLNTLVVSFLSEAMGTSSAHNKVHETIESSFGEWKEIFAQVASIAAQGNLQNTGITARTSHPIINHSRSEESAQAIERFMPFIKQSPSPRVTKARETEPWLLEVARISSPGPN